MKQQLEKIGIYDDATGNSLLHKNLVKSFFDVNNISGLGKTPRSVIKESFLIGPHGFLKVESIWIENKLITFMFFGG